mgnify:CR=1 FL=1
MSRTGVWIGLVVLFCAGALMGAVGTSLYYQYEDEHRWERGPGARQERIMKRLTQELILSTTQQAEVEPIVARAHLELLRLRVNHQPDTGSDSSPELTFAVIGLGPAMLKALRDVGYETPTAAVQYRLSLADGLSPRS